MDYVQDKSGINSLAGFSYQIKVFIFLAASIKQNTEIGFETLDDATVTANFDDINANILTDTIAVQVKNTKMTKAIAFSVFLNWVLLENSIYHVSKYILYTSIKPDYDFIKTIDINDFVGTIKASKKKKNSHEYKAKQILLQSENEFIKKCNDIKQKYELQIFNAKTEIENTYASLFMKPSNEAVYNLRLNSFISDIQNQILNRIEQNQSYSLDYETFYRTINQIIQNISVDTPVESYSDFVRNNKIQCFSKEIIDSREYKQLKFCNLNDNLIRQNLMDEHYYQKTRLNYLEMCNSNIVNDIEQLTYDNFNEVKFDLQQNKQDTPYKRLKGTKEKENSYAQNTNIKKGACIYLTRNDIQNQQISWKNEDGNN